MRTWAATTAVCCCVLTPKSPLVGTPRRWHSSRGGSVRCTSLLRSASVGHVEPICPWGAPRLGDGLHARERGFHSTDTNGGLLLGVGLRYSSPSQSQLLAKEEQGETTPVEKCGRTSPQACSESSCSVCIPVQEGRGSSFSCSHISSGSHHRVVVRASSLRSNAGPGLGSGKRELGQRVPIA